MKEELLKHVKRVKALYEKCKGNEALTKASLIGPLFTLLGYDLADPYECIPEFKADFGKDRSRDPVDWAFFQNTRPIFLVEAKHAGKDLIGYDPQLGDYFGQAQPGVELGVLTNGIMWWFFTDNITVHRMDLEPFFVWDVLKSDPSFPPGLLDLMEILQKSKFTPKNIETFAEKRHRQSLLVVVINRLLAPSSEFVKLAVCTAVNSAGDTLLSGKITEKVVDDWKLPIADAIHDWARQHNLMLALQDPETATKLETTRDIGKFAGKAEQDHYTDASLVSLIAARRLIPPLKLFRKYKGTRLEATLLSDGTVEFQGQQYDTCSGAAEAARATVSGQRMNTNGWMFWQYQGPNGSKLLLREARRQVGVSLSADTSNQRAAPGAADQRSLQAKLLGDKDESGAISGINHQDNLVKRFWESLLSRPKVKATRHANIAPSEYSWIGAGSGFKGLPFVYSIRQREGRVELYIDRGAGKAAENKKIFDRIQTYKEEIGKSFGNELVWQRLDDKRACRVAYILKDGGCKSDQTKWPEIQDAMIDAMVRLEQALAPHLKKLKAELATEGA